LESRTTITTSARRATARTASVRSGRVADVVGTRPHRLRKPVPQPRPRSPAPRPVASVSGPRSATRSSGIHRHPLAGLGRCPRARALRRRDQRALRPPRGPGGDEAMRRTPPGRIGGLDVTLLTMRRGRGVDDAQVRVGARLARLSPRATRRGCGQETWTRRDLRELVDEDGHRPSERSLHGCGERSCLRT